MADTAGADFTSSMTSVTEEDGSLSESDTTENYNSNFSSLMYSSDYNTDDKLTPSLNSISISKGSQKKVRNLIHGAKFDEDNHTSLCNRDVRTKTLGSQRPLTRPLAARCSSNNNSNLSIQKFCKKSETVLKNSERQKTVDSHRRNERNLFTFDYPDSHLYTDFTNNTTYTYVNVAENEIDTEDEGESEFAQDSSSSKQSFLPDMNSSSWYNAKIFDRYWLHYNFVMDWFKEHVKFVNGQYHQFFSSTLHTGFHPSCGRKTKTKERKRRRARKRRAAKAKQSQGPDSNEDALSDEKYSVMQEEETIEMEITEDMMKFFSQSYKHRLEREKLKENEERQEEESTRIDIEQTLVGQQGPTTTAPSERPGVRRTAEMKLLYGQGAAMIHGMETALQMTFDKVTDRHQPKLWPNMPLKLCFN